MGTSVLVSTLIPDNTNVQSNPASQQMASPQFLGIIIVGYIIMGLGILRGIRKK